MKKYTFSFILIFIFLISSSGYYSNEKQRPWRKYLKDESLELKIPDLQFFTLKNGIKVYYAENNMLPKTHLSIYLEGGEFEEPSEKTGLTSLWGDTIVYSGSKEYPRAKLAEYLEMRASSYSFSSGLERAAFSVSSLAPYFQDDLTLFLKIIDSPRFDDEDFQLLKKKTLKNIEKRKENPGRMSYIGSTLKFWQNTIRGRITTKKSIEAIDTADLRKWHKKMLNAERMTVLLAGDYKKTDVENILNQTIGSLKFDAKNRPSSAPLEKGPEKIKFKTYHIVKDIPQSTILLTARGINHSDNEYYPLKIYDFILGGSSFNSKLTQEIRTKKGWAYSVYSHYSSGLRFGSIRIFAQTGNENVFDLLRKVDSILSNPKEFVNTNSITEAKQSLKNKFIFLYETPEGLLSTQLSLMWDGLKPDYLKNFITNLENTGPQKVISLAQEFYKSEEFFLTIVGPENLFDDKNKFKDILWLQNIERIEIPE